MSSQPHMEGHLAIPQMAFCIQMNLLLAATCVKRPVLQGWLLIAGSTVVATSA